MDFSGLVLNANISVPIRGGIGRFDSRAESNVMD